MLNYVRTLDKDRYPDVERLMAWHMKPMPAASRIRPEPANRSGNRRSGAGQFGLSLERVLALCTGAEFGESKRWRRETPKSPKRVPRRLAGRLFGSKNGHSVGKNPRTLMPG